MLYPSTAWDIYCSVRLGFGYCLGNSRNANPAPPPPTKRKKNELLLSNHRAPNRKPNSKRSPYSHPLRHTFRIQQKEEHTKFVPTNYPKQNQTTVLHSLTYPNPSPSQISQSLPCTPSHYIPPKPDITQSTPVRSPPHS